MIVNSAQISNEKYYIRYVWFSFVAIHFRKPSWPLMIKEIFLFFSCKEKEMVLYLKKSIRQKKSSDLKEKDIKQKILKTYQVKDIKQKYVERNVKKSDKTNRIG